MEKISVIFSLFLIGILSQVTIGYLINNFQQMDELTSNLISDEFGDKGSGEELVPFLNPEGDEAFRNDQIDENKYKKVHPYVGNDSNEESISNSTKNEQDITSAENMDNNDLNNNELEELENFNMTENYKDKIYIEGSWLEFGDNDDKEPEIAKENVKTEKDFAELQPEDKDGEDLNTGSIGMGFFKEMREISKDVPNPVVEVPKAIKNTIVELPNNIRNSVAELPNKVRNTVGNVWNEVKEVPKKVISIPKRLPKFFNRSPAASTSPPNTSRRNGFFGIGK